MRAAKSACSHDFIMKLPKQKLMEGRTTFMIAHRLNTLRTCNLILVLDQGELVGIRNSMVDMARAAGH